MPAITFNLYDTFREARIQGGSIFDIEAPGGNGVKLAIVTNTEVPDQNLDDFWNDASANEVSGTNYTAGGNACANGTVTLDGAGLVKADFDDPATWSEHASGFSNGRRFILYRDTGTASTSELIGFTNAAASDFGNDTGDVTATFDAGGAFDSPR